MRASPVLRGMLTLLQTCLSLTFTLAFAFACAAPCALATGTPPSAWDVDGLSFAFEAPKLAESFRVSGFASLVLDDAGPLELSFVAGTWSLADLDGEVLLAGTYEQPSARRVALQLDPSGTGIALARHAGLASQWSLAAGLGGAASDPQLGRVRLRLRLQRRHSAGYPTVRARLRVALRTRGDVHPDQLASVLTGRARTRIVACSADVPEFLLDGSPPPPPPVASFTLGATSGQAPLTVGMQSTASGLVDERHWTFGDGTEADGVSVQHTFGPGAHVVTHRVSGPGGSHEAQALVNVANPPQPLQVLHLAWDVGDPLDPDDDGPRLAPSPGAGGLGSIEFGGGDELEFGYVLPLGTNGAEVVHVDLAFMSTPVFGVPSTHPLEVVVRWSPSGAEPIDLLGPTEVVVAGATEIALHTSDAPALWAQPGDRVALVLRDLAEVDPTGTVTAQVLLTPSRVELAGPP